MPLEFLATPVERLDGAGRAGGPLVSTVPLPRAPRIPQLPPSGLCGPREPLAPAALIGVRLLPPGADGATPLDPSVVTGAVDLGAAALTAVETNELGGHVPPPWPVVAGHPQATGVLAQLRGEELESGGIEVVGGLVQQQQVGPAAEHAREPHPVPLPRGERGQ